MESKNRIWSLSVIIFKITIDVRVKKNICRRLWRRKGLRNGHEKIQAFKKLRNTAVFGGYLCQTTHFPHWQG